MLGFVNVHSYLLILAKRYIASIVGYKCETRHFKLQVGIAIRQQVLRMYLRAIEYLDCVNKSIERFTHA